MIVRILNEGQWQVGDHLVDELNTLDDAVEKAVQAGDQDALEVALATLLDKVRTEGEAVPDDNLQDSDLILPDAGSTLDEVRAMLNDSEEGLIPG
jgi:ClpP class serine protease